MLIISSLALLTIKIARLIGGYIHYMFVLANFITGVVFIIQDMTCRGAGLPVFGTVVKCSDIYDHSGLQRMVVVKLADNSMARAPVPNTHTLRPGSTAKLLKHTSSIHRASRFSFVRYTDPFIQTSK